MDSINLFVFSSSGTCNVNDFRIGLVNPQEHRDLNERLPIGVCFSHYINSSPLHKGFSINTRIYLGDMAVVFITVTCTIPVMYFHVLMCNHQRIFSLIARTLDSLLRILDRIFAVYCALMKESSLYQREAPEL